MRRWYSLLLVAPVVVLGLAACEIQQEEEAELPEVEGGQLPEYEAETGDVEIEQDTVTVPEVEIEEPNATDGDVNR